MTLTWLNTLIPISDSGRLRTLVPLEGEYFLWNQ
jgi:hypothetical protein